MVYLCIRQTLDWSDEDAFWAQLPAGFAPTVREWNATFGLPYHLFRHRVREIARQNAETLRNVTCLPWNEIPAGALVLPADDDDWFAPEAGEVLEQAHTDECSTVGYHWPASFLEVPLNLGHRIRLWQRRVLPTPPKWICSTNNYAVAKSQAMDTIYDHHIRASRWFWDHPSQVGRLPGHLSLMNRTRASRTSLGMRYADRCKPIGRGRLLRKYREYSVLYQRPLPAALDWSRPYVRMMDDLMQELRPCSAGMG